MRTIRTLLFLVLAICVSTISYSQEYESTKDRDKNKPTLFDNHADSSDVHPNFFNVLSSAEINDRVTVHVTQQYILKGRVSEVEETADYRTVLINSEETPGLKLILSHTVENKYYGFISCKKHKDTLVLNLDEATNKYRWIKREVADILPD